MSTALVTGVSAGIGRAVAAALSGAGFHVIGAGRSESRTRPFVDEIAGTYLPLDLGSLESVRTAAATIDQRIDILVNNAGIAVGRGVTSEGFEIHFGVNHLGHFLLSSLLRRHLAGGRIVQVTSALHQRARGIAFGRMTRKTKGLYGYNEYAVSKLANILFVREAARRWPEIESVAVHPGMTDTAIWPRWVRPFILRNLITPEQGGATVVWAATSPEIPSGSYLGNRSVWEPSPVASDDDLARDLWEHSERWVALAT